MVSERSLAVPGGVLKLWIRQHLHERTAGGEDHDGRDIPIRVFRADHHLVHGGARFDVPT